MQLDVNKKLCIKCKICDINKWNLATLYNIPYCKTAFSVLHYRHKRWYQCTGKALRGSKPKNRRMEIMGRLESRNIYGPGRSHEKTKRNLEYDPLTRPLRKNNGRKRDASSRGWNLRKSRYYGGNAVRNDPKHHGSRAIQKELPNLQKERLTNDVR